MATVSWRRRLLRFVQKLGLLLLVPLLVLMGFRSSVTVMAAPPAPPISEAEQMMLDQANKGEAGAALAPDGYAAKRQVQDKELIEFLDTQLKAHGTDTPGPYVLMSSTTQKVAAPSADVPPDVIVDLASNSVAALSQVYNNERATACYNTVSVKELSGYWMVMDPFIRGKPADTTIPVGQKEVPQLPKGFKTTCYTYDPTS